MTSPSFWATLMLLPITGVMVGFGFAAVFGYGVQLLKAVLRGS